MDKSKPNKEFIKFIVTKLRRERGFISASSLSMAMKQYLPTEFQPEKGYFNKWMDHLYNIETDKSDKNMPFYQLNENNIIEKIKKEYNFWNSVNDAYLTKHNNIETWNNLNKIFESQCKNFEIVKINRPELYNSLMKYKINAMPPKPEIQKVKYPTNQFTRVQPLPSQPVSKSILKKPTRIPTPPKQVSIQLPNENLPHELPTINSSYINQPYIDSLNSVGSLLFPNIITTNNYNKYENLINLIKNLNNNDMNILYNFRTITHEIKSENLFHLFNEIYRVKN